MCIYIYTYIYIYIYILYIYIYIVVFQTACPLESQSFESTELNTIKGLMGGRVERGVLECGFSQKQAPTKNENLNSKFALQKVVSPCLGHRTLRRQTTGRPASYLHSCVPQCRALHANIQSIWNPRCSKRQRSTQETAH